MHWAGVGFLESRSWVRVSDEGAERNAGLEQPRNKLHWHISFHLCLGSLCCPSSHTLHHVQCFGVILEGGNMVRAVLEQPRGELPWHISFCLCLGSLVVLQPPSASSPASPSALEWVWRQETRWEQCSHTFLGRGTWERGSAPQGRFDLYNKAAEECLSNKTGSSMGNMDLTHPWMKREVVVAKSGVKTFKCLELRNTLYNIMLGPEKGA